MRLPRAEDRVALYIDVDGEMVEIEGVIQRITIRQGVDFLRQQMVVGERRASGEVTVAFRSMQRVEPEALNVLEEGRVVQVIQLPPEARGEILP